MGIKVEQIVAKIKGRIVAEKNPCARVV